MTEFYFLISCAEGLENALLTELAFLKLHGTKQRVGRVAITTDLAGLYRILLHSRVASRVLLPLGEYFFKTQDARIVDDIPQTLYEFAYQIDWTHMFGVDDTFAIRLSVDKRVALNQQYATLKIKDAIADHFMHKFGERPSVDKSPDFHIYAHISTTACELALDLSGGSLHYRGYRTAMTDAPLKENLAAALLYECGWHTGVFDSLIDPMCGSGTFVIEALLMHLAYPVGIDKRFGLQKWRAFDETLWQSVCQEALADFHHNLTRPLPKVYAFDADPKAVKATHTNITTSPLACLGEPIVLACQPIAKMNATLGEAAKPLIITNPPYGERLGEQALIKALYQGLGLRIKEFGQTAYLGVLAARIEEADTLPITDPQTLKCHNGQLTVYFRHGKVNHSPQVPLIQRFVKPTKTDEDSDTLVAQDFVNRLTKNTAHLAKIAKKQGITNLRLYDADLPDFNIAIDVYGDNVHIQEYAPPKTIDPQTAKQRFNLALSSVREVLAVNREQVFIKTRARQAGNEQYTRQGKSGKYDIVKEGKAYFYVNLTDYLDTGLFLDHRPLRQHIFDNAQGKTVLNLFAYTCTASVQVALGGASEVVSVDLSANYLLWGQKNFALNGLASVHYHFIQSDSFEWLKNHSERFDLIFIDPPTFSNSKKFFGTFEVQRDHAALINRAMNRLNTDGVLYFSNNFSRFVMSEEILARYEVVHMTEQTTGFDFKKALHTSFAIRHKHSSQTKSVGFKPHEQPRFVGQSLDDLSGDIGRFGDKRQDKPSQNAKPHPKHKDGRQENAQHKDAKYKDTKYKDDKQKSDKRGGRGKFGDNFGRFGDNANRSRTKTDKPNTPTPKRVYVNPKLKDGDKIAKRLTQALSNQQMSNQQKGKDDE